MIFNIFYHFIFNKKIKNRLEISILSGISLYFYIIYKYYLNIYSLILTLDLCSVYFSHINLIINKHKLETINNNFVNKKRKI